MTVSFELPDYCEGCNNMHIEQETGAFYADSKPGPEIVIHSFRCIHQEQCSHLLKSFMIRFGGNHEIKAR